MHYVSDRLTYTKHHVQDKVPIVVPHMYLRFGSVSYHRLWYVPLNGLLVHRFSLTLPASSLYEGLYLIHWSQIPSVLSDNNIADAVDLLVVYQGPLSFLFLYLGLLGLDILLDLVS
jgi:hypothetical protein